MYIYICLHVYSVRCVLYRCLHFFLFAVYILCMYMSGKPKSDVSAELEAFLKNDADELVEWLWTRAEEVAAEGKAAAAELGASAASRCAWRTRAPALQKCLPASRRPDRARLHSYGSNRNMWPLLGCCCSSRPSFVGKRTTISPACRTAPQKWGCGLSANIPGFRG